MRRERRNGVIMSESYAVNEKREQILQKVKEFIVAHGGIVKKNQLEELHIDYRRILDFVEKGDLIRIKSGYYTIRIGDYSEDELIVKLFPDAVLTMECALYAYGYIKRKPYGYQIAVDKNTSNPDLSWSFRRSHRFMRSRRRYSLVWTGSTLEMQRCRFLIKTD